MRDAELARLEVARQNALDAVRELGVRVAATRTEKKRTKEAKDKLRREGASASRLEIALAEYVLATRVYEQALADASQAKREFLALNTQYRDKRAESKIAEAKRQEDIKIIAEKIGIPDEYWDNMVVRIDRNGVRLHFLFGGKERPAGPGHGHYVVDKEGSVIYRRDPGEKHGAANFTPQHREDTVRQLAQMGVRWMSGRPAPRTTRYDNGAFHVTTISTYDKHYKSVVTTVSVIDRTDRGREYCVVVDQYGRELSAGWQPITKPAASSSAKLQSDSV